MRMKLWMCHPEINLWLPYFVWIPAWAVFRWECSSSPWSQSTFWGNPFLPLFSFDSTMQGNLSSRSSCRSKSLQKLVDILERFRNLTLDWGVLTEVAEDSELADSDSAGLPALRIFFFFLGLPFNFGAENSSFEFKIWEAKKFQDYYRGDCKGMGVLPVLHNRNFLCRTRRTSSGSWQQILPSQPPNSYAYTTFP